MERIFNVKLNKSLKKHFDLQKAAEDVVEINLSDESDVIYHLIMNDAYDPDKHFAYLSPLMTRKIASIISEEPFYDISLKTTPEGHKLRGKKSDIKKLLSRLKERI